MAATIVCPQCGLQGQLPDGSPSAETQCPRCGTVIPVVAAVRPAPMPPAPMPPAPMPPSANGYHDSYTRTLDQFFAAAFTQRPRQPGPEPSPPSSGGNTGPLAVHSRPSPDPHADPRAEREWLREEHERLQAYMRNHFALVQQQRQEFDGFRSRVEATLAGREQELGHEKKILAGQQEALTQREAAQMERLKQGDAEVLQRRQTVEQVQKEIAAEQARLKELRKATAHVKTDYFALQNAVRGRQQAAQLGPTEREVRELEAQIRGELERQEQDLARQRRELQEWRDRMVQDSCEKDALRRKVGVLARELEQLRRSAGQAR